MDSTAMIWLYLLSSSNCWFIRSKDLEKEVEVDGTEVTAIVAPFEATEDVQPRAKLVIEDIGSPPDPGELEEIADEVIHIL